MAAVGVEIIGVAKAHALYGKADGFQALNQNGLAAVVVGGYRRLRQQLLGQGQSLGFAHGFLHGEMVSGSLVTSAA